MAGRYDQSGKRRGAEQRGVVDRCGPETGVRLDELELEDTRQQLVGVTQQRVHRLCGDRGVVALLLDRRSEHDTPVLARHEVHL